MYFPVTYSATERAEELPEAVATVRELLDMIVTLKLCEKQRPVVEFLRKTAARIHRKWNEMIAAEAATAEMMGLGYDKKVRQ